VKTVIIKLINYGGRLGKNIQCNLNITRGYRISEYVHSKGSLYASGGGREKTSKTQFLTLQQRRTFKLLPSLWMEEFKFPMSSVPLLIHSIDF